MILTINYPWKVIDIPPLDIHVRQGTKDQRVLQEVLGARTYRHTRIKFDVDLGENWLDLGGHIGTFGLYALLRGAARVDSVEAEATNYKIAFRNQLEFQRITENYAEWNVLHAAASLSPEKVLNLYTPTRKREGAIPNTKFSLLSSPQYSEKEQVRNYRLTSKKLSNFDGIKMDIEGAELSILQGLVSGKLQLPERVNKLVFEYHFTKHRNLAVFFEIIAFLKSIFQTVQYPAHLDKMGASLEEYPGMYDRLVFCKDRY